MSLVKILNENFKFRNKVENRSQDGRGIGWGDHFLSYKFIKRTSEW